MKKCKECKGLGYVWETKRGIGFVEKPEKIKCPKCQGRGTR